jgi:hypothetical protein
VNKDEKNNTKVMYGRLPQNKDEFKESLLDLIKTAEDKSDYIAATYILQELTVHFGPKVLISCKQYMEKHDLTFELKDYVSQDIFENLGLGFLLDDSYVYRYNEIAEKEKNEELSDDEKSFRDFCLYIVWGYRDLYGLFIDDTPPEKYTKEQLIEMINGIVGGKPMSPEEYDQICEETNDYWEKNIEYGEAWLTVNNKEGEC